MSEKEPQPMTVGSRVRVVAAWSMFKARGGTIVDEIGAGRLLVLLDGELLPIRFDAAALEVVS